MERRLNTSDGASSRGALGRRILLAFLLYGLVVGPWSVWWSGTPVCSIIPANIPGVLLGDWIYELSVRRLSRPLPTALRVPYVYVPSSALFWTLLGVALQLLQDRLLAKSLSPRELRNLWRLIVLLVALTLGFTLIWTLDILLPTPPGGSPSLSGSPSFRLGPQYPARNTFLTRRADKVFFPQKVS